MKTKIRELIKELNLRRNTTVVLTTHDIGDVDALCNRIIIIDKGTVLYDNSASNLKKFFGVYRTLKLKFSEHLSAYEISAKLHIRFPNSSSIMVNSEDEWFAILSREDETPVMEILQFMQEIVHILDIKIEEITTEDIIKKIYEGTVV